MSGETTSLTAASAASTSRHSSVPAPSGGRRILSRLGVRGRLFAMAITLIGLGAVCVVVATSGLIGQKSKVHQVDSTFKTFSAERDAYEGWLTADDQMNMYAALEVLRDHSQRQLANVTWNQVVQGHAQAIASLRWLIAHATDSAVRSSAQSTLTDLRRYYRFTLRMHAAVLRGNPRLAVRLVTVNNAPASNKTQADFDAMGKALTAAAARINGQADSAASSSEQLVIIVALITIVLSVLITWYLARLDKVCAAAKRCVMVVVSGRPLILDPAQRNESTAIVASWLPGSEGAGVADDLFGVRPFTGKLPVSWPRTLSQEPINVGDPNYNPLYRYGYGLTTYGGHGWYGHGRHGHRR